MSKRYLGAIALGAGLIFVPLSVGTSSDGTIPTLAVSEACASECCSFSLGDICLRGGDVLSNYRSTSGSCIKPGT